MSMMTSKVICQIRISCLGWSIIRLWHWCYFWSYSFVAGSIQLCALLTLMRLRLTSIFHLQSPELSGTNWFDLSAVQLGLVVCFKVLFQFWYLFNDMIIWMFLFGLFLIKVSGSLYGALLGSLIVYPIADFLGTLLSRYCILTVVCWIYY